MTTVLMDYHHNDLWESMELLAKRLGWALFRPIGMDWFDEGYWNHERKFHGDAVARQYLEPWGTDEPRIHAEQGAYPGWLRLDRSHGRWMNMLTLEQARDVRPDIVISSLAHNHEGFSRFANEVGATFGLQIGNVRFSAQDMAEDRWDLAAFGLVSGLMPVEPPKPHVVYHQEFSLDDFRPGRPPRLGLVVSSFVQCYPQDTTSYQYWLRAAETAPEHDWRVYGAYGTAALDRFAAGNLDRCAAVGDAMRASDVAWHAKRWSDGFGHVIHNWFAVGRPLLGFRDYYKDQLAGRLWVEGETAWDLERNDVTSLLRRFRDDEDFHIRACEAAAARFREVVSYDEEEQAIRDLFSRVL
jgi:hypothetical protein